MRCGLSLFRATYVGSGNFARNSPSGSSSCKRRSLESQRFRVGSRSSPVEWCNRFVSFGLGYALSWSGVSSCWVGWGVSRDLVRMSRLR